MGTSLIPLQERLENLDDKYVAGFVEKLESRRNGMDEYIAGVKLKNDSKEEREKLAKQIVGPLNDHYSKIKNLDSFAAEIASELKSEEILIPLKGLCELGSPNPAIKEVFSKLTNWEKIHFLSGYTLHKSWGEIYKYSSMEEPRPIDSFQIINRERSIGDLVSFYIKQGIDGVHKQHLDKKYLNWLKLPESENYHLRDNENYKKNKKDFKLLLDDYIEAKRKNDVEGVENTQIRINALLQLCDLNTLEKLSRMTVDQQPNEKDANPPKENKNQKYKELLKNHPEIIGKYTLPPIRNIKKD